MYSSHFDSLSICSKYKGYTICKGTLYIYQDDVEVQCHKGYGVFQGATYLEFRFTQKAAKDFINYLESTCPV